MSAREECQRCGRKVPKRREATGFCSNRCAEEQHRADVNRMADELAYLERQEAAEASREPSEETSPSTRRLRKYEQLKRAALHANEAFRDYQRKLATDCDHPEQYVADYQWEADNGYGRQWWMTGKRCEICGAKKSHEGAPWSSVKPTTDHETPREV